jgi:hypothetical protein
MNFLKTLCVFGSLSLFAYSTPAIAGIADYGDFRTGITSYPPGCVSSIYFLGDFPANGVESESVYSGTIPLQAWTDSGSESVDIEVEILRVGCAEKDKSVILVQLHYPIEGTPGDGIVLAPHVTAAGDFNHWLALNQEPHTLPGWHEFLAEGDNRTYFLQDGPTWAMPMLASLYNGAFELQFWDSNGEEAGPAIPIPAYDNQLQSSELSITGRLSGLWIVPETEDQGFLISVNELLSPYSRPLVIFLSWNTFDSDGNPLWLSGASTFSEFDSDVEIELILVEDGEFLGTKKANRTVVGNIQLHVMSCAKITAQYELEAIGLGTDEIALTRLFNMETAGFPCQDYETRSHH